MATATAPTTTNKILVIIGGTGVGKSLLSSRLAKTLDGEVVNADAMQMYKGLDLATAKPSPSELREVKHHLVATLDPFQAPITVREYRDMALHSIKQIWERGKLPIVCGGTLYYVQSILWHALLDEQSGFEMDPPPTHITTPPPHTAPNTSSAELHAKLALIDPNRASQLHPNDRRKIVRSLEIYEALGKPHSLATTTTHGDDASLSAIDAPPRFNFRIMWLTCDKQVHEERLKQRVDAMVDGGLIDEVKTFLREVRAKNQIVDTTKGLFQAMGYKEMEPVLQCEDDASKLMTACKERLTIHHRQYVRKQLHWIRKRILPRNIPVYALDTTDVNEWTRLVYDPALAVAQELLLSSPTSLYITPPFPQSHPFAQLSNITEKPMEKRLFTCELCNVKCIGREMWESHVNSRRHRHIVAGNKKREQEDKRQKMMAQGQGEGEEEQGE